MKEGMWLKFRGKQAEAIHEAIEGRGEFTTVVSRSEIKPRLHQFCIVSLATPNADSDKPFEYVGIARAGSLIATDQKRIKISNLVPTNCKAIEDMAAHLPPRFRNRLSTGWGPHVRLTSKFLQSLLNVISGTSNQIRDGMAGLKRRLAELDAIQIQSSGDINALERDAVVTTLETFGGTAFRKEILRGVSPPSTETPSFLSRLTHYAIREDVQINFDAISFPGCEVVKQHVTGAVEVRNPMGNRLTIMNCNRQPLEETLGVDLIYYSHSYNSFVLVQYKRLVAKGTAKPAYYPNSDENYAVEISKMNEFMSRLKDAQSDSLVKQADYRLGSDTFFFKFCEAIQKSSLDAGMISGMYIPLGLWNQFAASPDSKGSKGGFRLDRDIHPRYFNNSKFCDLLREGWIGSSASQSEFLGKVIESTLAGKRMLVLAATSPRESSPDLLRDDLGRFTNREDPLGFR